MKNGTTQVDIDLQQDCKNFQYSITNETVKWSFTRKFVTCDKHDYPLEVRIMQIDNLNYNMT